MASSCKEAQRIDAPAPPPLPSSPESPPVTDERHRRMYEAVQVLSNAPVTSIPLSASDDSRVEIIRWCEREIPTEKVSVLTLDAA
jgi:hypothetical protein